MYKRQLYRQLELTPRRLNVAAQLRMAVMHSDFPHLREPGTWPASWRGWTWIDSDRHTAVGAEYGHNPQSGLCSISVLVRSGKNNEEVFSFSLSGTRGKLDLTTLEISLDRPGQWESDLEAYVTTLSDEELESA